jgi:hypothetical protein
MTSSVRHAPSRFLQLVTATAVVAAALAWSAGVHAQSSPAVRTQTSAVQGVTVKVTPKPLVSGAAEWEFSVVLDTHSGNLDDDIAKSAVLVVDGKDLAPTAWAGAAAGGHHREGVLKFPAPAQPPGAVELRIRRSGEAEPRVFRWDAAGLR